MSTRAHRRRARIGQHFLVDENMAAFMCKEASIVPGDRVLEIGSGRGILTRAILQAGPELLFSIELDRKLEGAVEPLIGEHGNLKVIWKDALSIDYRSTFSEPPNKVVANIPYQITTELLWKLLEEAAPIGAGFMLLMVQREAAERIQAPARTRRSNPLSLTLSRMGSVKVVKHVPPVVFSPQPKVESAIIRISLSDCLFLENNPCWRFFLEKAFHQRRKTLLNNIVHGLHEKRDEVLEWFEKLEIGEMQRAEELETVKLEGLFRKWNENRRAGC